MPSVALVPTADVHVWSVRLDEPFDRDEEALLSGDEAQRASRFQFARDRQRFIARRIALRTILGQYLDCHPAQLTFRYGLHGKPSLLPANRVPLSFNASHSQHLAVIAVTAERDLGVDVEMIRAIPDADAVASRFFTRGENDALRAVPPGERIEAFYRCWTRKEAFVKVSGAGLTRPLDSFDVSIGPDDEARLLSCADSDEAAWSLRAFTPEPGFTCAIAAPGTSWRLHTGRWTGRPHSSRG